MSIDITANELLEDDDARDVAAGVNEDELDEDDIDTNQVADRSS